MAKSSCMVIFHFNRHKVHRHPLFIGFNFPPRGFKGKGSKGKGSKGKRGNGISNEMKALVTDAPDMEECTSLVVEPRMC